MQIQAAWDIYRAVRTRHPQMPGRDDIVFVPEDTVQDSVLWHVVLNPSMLYIGSLVEDRPGEIIYLNMRIAGNC